MNVTPDFVFVHMPKTGGTFVSSALGQLIDRHYYQQSGRLGALYWMAKRGVAAVTRRPLAHIEFDKHGTCRDIPDIYRDRPIVSCMRNPLDWYVSNYKFAYWKSHPHLHPDLMTDAAWPNLQFADYMRLSHSSWYQMVARDIVVNPTLGRLTTIFINFYCRNPKQILQLDADTAAIVDAVKQDMFPTTFLDTNDLSQSLVTYLNQFYLPERTAFILEKKKISPRNQRTAAEKWQQFYTPAMIEAVRTRDRVLFALFPALSVG